MITVKVNDAETRNFTVDEFSRLQLITAKGSEAEFSIGEDGDMIKISGQGYIDVEDNAEPVTIKSIRGTIGCIVTAPVAP
ncbi:MAG: hypothetical protein HRU20_14570 [Pseudomonadales bacterium]|nr:hypothetical protein [Pseudomonadales bacterium]